MMKAISKLERLSFDEREREIYEAEVKARMDDQEELRTAREKGRQEGETIGIEKGIEKGRQEGETIGIEKGVRLTACRLLHTGLPIEVIADVTGLSLEEIAGIAGEQLPN